MNEIWIMLQNKYKEGTKPFVQTKIMFPVSRICAWDSRGRIRLGAVLAARRALRGCLGILRLALFGRCGKKACRSQDILAVSNGGRGVFGKRPRIF